MSQQNEQLDAKRLERFVIFVRLVHQAKQAGVNQHEAAHAIYPDAFPDDLESAEIVKLQSQRN